MIRIDAQTRILVTTHTRPDYMPIPAYSKRMLVCSPHYPDQVDPDGTIRSVRVPNRRPYDLASLIDSLPAAQQPDVVICRLDASFQNIPGNIRQIRQPTLAMIGDTHHMRRPLQYMLSYLQQERYDQLLIDHTPQHGHWFLEAGLGPIHFLPGWLLADHWQKPADQPEAEIAFIGQMGKAHPVRNRRLQAIRDADLPLWMDSLPQSLGQQRYNRAAISFNQSLNGDLNLRCLEVMANGGMLLTDRLEPQSGLSSLFTEGEHLVSYEDTEDLLEKCRYYLRHPAERNRIAAAGFRLVRKLFGMEARRRRLADIFNQRLDSRHRIGTIDPRPLAYGCRNRNDLIRRMAIYEWVQEQHRHFDSLTCTVYPGVDPRLVCDLADLPRLRFRLGDSPEVQKLAQAAGIREARLRAEPRPGSVQISLHCFASLQEATLDERVDAVLLSDWLQMDPVARERASTRCGLAGMDLVNHTEGLYVRERDWSDVWNRPPHS